MKKHLVIDARRLNSSTGIYMQNLLREINLLNPEEFRITALVPSQLVKEWANRAPHISFVGADQGWYSFSEQLSLALQLYRLHPDLVHFTMPQQPLLYFGRRVTTIHDTILVRFDNVDMNPLLYKIRKGIFSFLLRNVAWRSRTIITPTKFVRDDIADLYSEKLLEKILVTPEAGDPLAASAEPIAKLEGKKFLTFIGNAFPYKNLNLIVDAYAELKKTHPELELAFAGRKDSFYEEIEARVKEMNLDGVHILGFISEGEKRWLLHNAQCYVVASLSEGFHIPGLEAMYEDCPVLSADASCLPEVYDDAALYFDPHSVDSLVDALEKILTDSDLRTSLVIKGRTQVKKFSWSRMAEQSLAAYRRSVK